MADYFQDKVDAIGNKLNVPASRRFTTLSGYKKLLECTEVDAVVIQSPPYFHPEQAQAAVDAGKHVYLAKPIAVDVPGCQTIEASGKAATAKKRCFQVDFQTRANAHYVEAIRRVHEGAIGEYVFGEAITHTSQLGTQAEPGTPGARLRNWVFDKALSGDIITEQQIHTLDVMSWVMNTTPLCATGTGGRKVRTHVGDCWDYFTVLFEYPNQVGVPTAGGSSMLRKPGRTATGSAFTALRVCLRQLTAVRYCSAARISIRDRPTRYIRKAPKTTSRLL